MAAKITKEQWEEMLPPHFKFHKFCNCGGTPKYKYKGNNGVELHILPNKNVFRTWLGGGRPGPSGYLETLKTQIENL